MLSSPDRSSNRARRIVGRAALAFALSASLLIPGGAARAQSDEEKAAARALATQGAEALNNKKFAEALDLVGRAEAIVHAPTHLLLIARAQVGIGKLVSAQETFLKLTREELAPNAPAAFKNAQAAAREELAAIEPRIASLRIVLDGLGQRKATVKMDEQQVPAALVGVFRPVDPGKHEIGIYPVGGAPVKGVVELKDGEKKDFKIFVPDGPPPSGVPLNAADNPDAPKTVTPEAPPTKDQAESKFMTPLRGAGFGVGALGVAGLVVGGIFIAKSGSTQTKANDMATAYGCDPKCDVPKTAAMKEAFDAFKALDRDAATQKTIGAVGFITGGVALAGGVAMIILGKPKPGAAPAKKASMEPWFDGKSLGLRGEF
ncbi:Hypothetical protein A7982_03499 [Minicystis rosea]|nr:Hypothetical protein A7982_03499 [Minicystis rosea]